MASAPLSSSSRLEEEKGGQTVTRQRILDEDDFDFDEDPGEEAWYKAMAAAQQQEQKRPRRSLSEGRQPSPSDESDDGFGPALPLDTGDGRQAGDNSSSRPVAHRDDDQLLAKERPVRDTAPAVREFSVTGQLAWEENRRMRAPAQVAKQAIKMPWEKPPFDLIFPGCAQQLVKLPCERLAPSLCQLPTREVYAHEQLLALRRYEHDIGIFTRAVRDTKNLTFKDMQNKLQQNVLNKILLVIEENLYASKVGRDLLQLHRDGRYTDEAAASLIMDTLGTRKPGTVLKRICALQRFVLWVRKERARPALPMTEHDAYMYACHLRNEGAATAPLTFMGSVAFANHVLSIDGADEVEKSARTRGVALTHLQNKQTREVRAPLETPQARIVEEAVFRAPTVVDRNLSGFCCFLLYGRARFHDAMMASSILDDFTNAPDNGREGFVELLSDRVKTGTGPNKSCLLLPMVAPARGLGPDVWAEAWFDARRQKDLGFSDLEFVQPAPNRQGEWLPRPWTTEEAATWLRQLFAMSNCPLKFGRPFGTHVLKKTLLSWLAKAGAPTGVRRTAGYHIAADEHTTFLYGRENMAEPLRWIQTVLQAIRDGVFMPDATRSGRLVGGLTLRQCLENKSTAAAASNARAEKPRATTELPSGEQEAASDDSGSSVSSASSSDDEMNAAVDEAIAEAQKKPVLYDPAQAPETFFFQHTNSGTLHMKRPNEEKLGCGRMISERFSKVKKPLRFQWPICETCQNYEDRHRDFDESESRDTAT